MADYSTTAHPYAKAVFELARDSGSYEAWSDSLSAIATLQVNGADTSVACSIAYPAVTCDSGAAAVAVPAGSRLAIKLSGALLGAPGNANYNRDALFSFRTTDG